MDARGLRAHGAEWPTASSRARTTRNRPGCSRPSATALIGIRRAKTEAKASQKTEVTSAVLSAPAAQLALIRKAADDLRAVGRISTLTFVEGDEIAISDVVFTEQVD